jgi:aminoglycoside phosphotransferase (APT) family kinase protein
VTGLPPAHPSVSVETAAALLADQFPEYAGLALGTMTYGWDNAMIRLGTELAVRMPRLDSAVGSLLKERDLLHRLGGRWTFPFPRIVEDGEPGHGYPWPWSIVTWLDGTPAVDSPLGVEGAASLGRALAQIHEPAPPDAPFNDEQSLRLSERDEDLATQLGALADRRGPHGERLSAGRAHELWDAALAAAPPAHAVWSHADLHGHNVLSGSGGQLAGIIDWGDISACDPAVDLGFVYALTGADGVAAAIASYADARPSDEALALRVRGVGLHASARLAASPSAETSAMGWRGLASLGVTDRD